MPRCSTGVRDSGVWLDVVKVIMMLVVAICSAGDIDVGLWQNVVQVFVCG